MRRAKEKEGSEEERERAHDYGRNAQKAKRSQRARPHPLPFFPLPPPPPLLVPPPPQHRGTFVYAFPFRPPCAEEINHFSVLSAGGGARRSSLNASRTRREAAREAIRGAQRRRPLFGFHFTTLAPVFPLKMAARETVDLLDKETLKSELYDYLFNNLER